MFERVMELNNEIQDLENTLNGKRSALSDELKEISQINGTGPHAYNGHQVRIVKRGETYFLRTLGRD